MTPTIVSGFPGVGKTQLVAKTGWHDSDSSKFSWIEPGVRNPDFPANYIEHIKSIQGVVLVSSHKAVREALADANMPFMLVYPVLGAKDAYMKRYKERGSTEQFLATLDTYWYTWVMEMQNESRCKYSIELGPNVFLSDVEAEIRMFAGLSAKLRR